MLVPGHTGVDGNVEADQLANKGSAARFIGPEPFFGNISMKYKTDFNDNPLKGKRIASVTCLVITC
jgi:ribonuclease HI